MTAKQLDDNSDKEKPIDNKVSRTAINDDANAQSSHNLNFIANIAQFNERPDLMITLIEEHNPGFIKRTTDNIEIFDQEFRQKRFKFGDKQAYTSLIVRWIGIVICSIFSGFVIWFDIVGFWNTTLIILILAGTQSGFSGFNAVVVAFSELIYRFKRRE